MMTGWQETNLGQYVDFRNGKTSPDRDDSMPFPVYGSNGVIGRANISNANENSIVIGRVGSYCGSLYFSKSKAWVTDNAIIAEAKKGNNPLYFFYLMSGLDLNHLQAGSGQPLINQSILSSIKTAVAPQPEQRAIAAVLGALDDKIELNSRMNATLEAAARALFKSWFVDFDPVKAKMAGNQPFGMDATAAALFPARLTESELGDIPDGWSVSNIGTEFDITMGQSPPGETYNENGEGLPFYQGRTDFGFRFPTPRIHCTQPNRVAEAGDTLISVRAPVGDINMAYEKCILGRGVGALRHKSKARGYTHYAIKSIQGSLKAFEADGTVFGSVGKQDLEKVKFLRVPATLAEKFELQISAFDDKILILTDEIKSLERTRDYLLPKLISGEIRIPDAEKFVKGLV
jgi:type I restriction enzyme S subunit